MICFPFLDSSLLLPTTWQILVLHQLGTKWGPGCQGSEPAGLRPSARSAAGVLSAVSSALRGGSGLLLVPQNLVILAGTQEAKFLGSREATSSEAYGQKLRERQTAQ